MRKLAPFTTALLALALVVAASASAAQTYTCVLPTGAGGEAMEVVLSAKAGGCPGPGVAVPREWIVGEPRPIGTAAQAVKGESVTAPPSDPVLVRAEPLGDPRAIDPGVAIPASVVAAIEDARASSAAVVADAPAAPSSVASGDGHWSPGDGFLAMMIALVALVAGGLVAVRDPARATRTA